MPRASRQDRLCCGIDTDKRTIAKHVCQGSGLGLLVQPTCCVGLGVNGAVVRIGALAVVISQWCIVPKLSVAAGRYSSHQSPPLRHHGRSVTSKSAKALIVVEQACAPHAGASDGIGRRPKFPQDTSQSTSWAQAAGSRTHTPQRLSLSAAQHLKALKPW